MMTFMRELPDKSASGKPAPAKPGGTTPADRGFQPALKAAGEAKLGHLIERAQWLEALDQRLRRYLPAALQTHCHLGNVDAGKLVFVVDAPVWNAKLRQHAGILLDAAIAAGLQAHTLTIRVVAPPPASPGRAAPKPLSQATRDALRATAQSVADPELRAQLLKLASLA
jgi:hypothetical protein